MGMGGCCLGLGAGVLRPVLVQALAGKQEPAAASSLPADAAAEAPTTSSLSAAAPGTPADQQAGSPHAEVLDRPSPSEPQLASLACVSPIEGAISSKGRADSSAVDDPDAEEEECVVCWAAGAEVVFQPCGHLCTCCSCAQPFLGRSLACPMCRATVAGGISLER